MTLYTAHIPPGAHPSPGPLSDPPDDTVLVADGFHLFAMLVPPLWMLHYRQWFGLIAFLVIGSVLILLSGIVASWALLLVTFLMAVLFGIEASTLRRWRLEQGGWQQVDAFAARGRTDAELRFLERWKGGQLSNLTSASGLGSNGSNSQNSGSGPDKASRPPSVIGYSRD